MRSIKVIHGYQSYQLVNTFLRRIRTYQELPIQLSQDFIVQSSHFLLGLSSKQRVPREDFCSQIEFIDSLGMLDVGFLDRRPRRHVYRRALSWLSHFEGYVI